MAGGILRPVRGRILLAGDVVRELPRRRLAQRVALVPQNMHVPFPFRVGELVLMGRAPHQSLIGLESEHDVELARAALERLGILNLADRSITTLSGGERQLVLFARALVQDPDLLLLDEPTAFLDLKHRVEVLREVRRFTNSQRAALIVSHDLSLAARCCDRVVLLGNGRVVAQGPAAEVLTSANLRSPVVVIVDDDDLFRESLEQNLTESEFEVVAFADAPAALDYLAGHPSGAGNADLVLLDWKMSPMSGIELLRRLREDGAEVPVIFLTALSDQIYEEAVSTLIPNYLRVRFLQRIEHFDVIASQGLRILEKLGHFLARG